MPVVGGALLVPVDLDGQRVDVDDAEALPGLGRADSDGPPTHDARKDGAVVVGAEPVKRPRQRRLRREAVPVVVERMRPGLVADGEAERGVMAEEIAVVEVREPLGGKVEQRANELCRGKDGDRTAIVDETVGEASGESEALVGGSQQQCTGVTREFAVTCLDNDRPIESHANYGLDHVFPPPRKRTRGPV
jgi:hypothetical protein